MIEVQSNKRADKILARDISLQDKRLKVKRYVNNEPNMLYGNYTKLRY